MAAQKGYYRIEIVFWIESKSNRIESSRMFCIENRIETNSIWQHWLLAALTLIFFWAK